MLSEGRPQHIKPSPASLSLRHSIFTQVSSIVTTIADPGEDATSMPQWHGDAPISVAPFCYHLCTSPHRSSTSPSSPYLPGPTDTSKRFPHRVYTIEPANLPESEVSRGCSTFPLPSLYLKRLFHVQRLQWL